MSDLHPGNADAILNFRMPSFEGFGVEHEYSALARIPLSPIAEDSGLNIRNRRTQNILEGVPCIFKTLTELLMSSSGALAARSEEA